jgi:16S rRNA (adenine1518-N6/adenine1519-N6)-dimethyltransferase
VRLGQNFLADPNLLEAIVRDSGAGPGDVVLEVGGGEGALSERLAPRVAHLHVIELDERLREPLRAVASAAGNVSLHFGDAMKLDLAGLHPAPSRMVANLPYSIATPLLIRTIEELPELGEWTVMVQREIADRLRAAPGTREYASASVLVQLCCEVELVRKVGRQVFSPPPRVDSAVLRLRRGGPLPPPEVRELIRAAFAHRRKPIAGSLRLAAREGSPGWLLAAADRAAVRDALERLGHAADTRAEALSPHEWGDFAALLGVEAATGRSPGSEEE